MVGQKDSLFASKSDVNRAMKEKSIRINRVALESIDETLEAGDFLNGTWIPHMLEAWEAYGYNLLTVHRGKRQANLVRVNGWQNGVLKVEVLF